MPSISILSSNPLHHFDSRQVRLLIAWKIGSVDSKLDPEKLWIMYSRGLTPVERFWFVSLGQSLLKIMGFRHGNYVNWVNGWDEFELAKVGYYADADRFIYETWLKVNQGMSSWMSKVNCNWNFQLAEIYTLYRSQCPRRWEANEGIGSDRNRVLTVYQKQQ